MIDKFDFLNLSGQVALVTGGNKGIGYGCAKLLAIAGAEIVILSRSGVSDDKLYELQLCGSKIYSLKCDINDIARCKSLLQTVPPANILVNNAGTNIPMPINRVTEDIFDEIIGLNLRSVYFLTQLIVNYLVEKKIEGSIINISSQMGHVGDENRTVYCASKHAIEGFTKSLAVELADKKIRVNSVCPTFVETDMTKPFFEDSNFKESVLSRIPKGELVSIDDIAKAVLFLASGGSRMITGTSIKVDGGWTAQ